MLRESLFDFLLCSALLSIHDVTHSFLFCQSQTLGNSRRPSREPICLFSHRRVHFAAALDLRRTCAAFALGDSVHDLHDVLAAAPPG
jgi:hypothetical protein